YDDLSLLVVLKSDGNIEKKVIGSVVESIAADTTLKNEWERLKEIFRKPSLQMVSFTITEKGYSLVDSAGVYLGIVLDDFKAGYNRPTHLMGKITALLHERYLGSNSQPSKLPISMVSMDNCSHNGDKLFEAVEVYAKNWVNNGFIDEGFLGYIRDTNKVAFPWSMIDKITPRPDDKIKFLLEEDGFEDTELIITSKNTYT